MSARAEPSAGTGGVPSAVVSAAGEESDRRRGILRDARLLTLLGILFLVMVGFGIVIPTLPFLARDLGASATSLGVMTSLYALAQFAFAPYWGSLSDRIGRRKLLITGMAGFSLSFLWMGTAGSFLILCISRVLGGLLSSATMPVAQAFAADVTPPEERGRVMGLMGAAMGVGFIFGPVIGGFLIPFGYRVPFFAGGGLGAATVLAALLVLPEPQKTAPGAGKPARQSRLANTLVALRSPIAAYFWLALVLSFANSSMFSMLAFYLADRYGAGAQATGAAFGLLGLSSAVIQALLVGPVTRWAGEDRVILLSLGLGAVGFLVMAIAAQLWVAFLAIIVATGGTALGRPAITAAASRQTPLPQGITMGLQTSFDSLGRIVGPLWAGVVYGFSITGPHWSALAACGLAAGAVVRWLKRKEAGAR